MSKNGKTRRKNEKKRRLRDRRSAVATVIEGVSSRPQRGKRWQQIISRAESLIDEGRWDEAGETLERFERANPGRPEVLRLLLDVYHQKREFASYQHVSRLLLKQTPNDPDVYAMMAGACLANAQPVTALEAFRRFIQRWRDHPFADGARDMVAQLEPMVAAVLAGLPFPKDQRLELAQMHEEVLACVAAGQFELVISAAQRLLARCADFSPALNNLSLAYFMTGRSEEAIRTTRRVLQIDPDNVHAQANLTRYLFFGGHRAEGEQWRRRLRAARSDNPEIWSKKAETFGYLGDDQGVLDAFDEAKRVGYLKAKTPDVALMYHLAGVAHARQGRMSEARAHWRRALRIMPDLALPAGNLEDAKKPVGERHGPWAFTVDYWLPKDTIERLLDELELLDFDGDERSAARAARRFAAKWPGLHDIVEALLDRGDELGRGIAWRLAMALETPEMLAKLREFCLSRRGPDAMRLDTAGHLSRKGVIEAGPMWMWIKGEHREIEAMGFEVTEKPVGELHREPVNTWAYNAMQAIGKGNGEEAERLLRKCLDAVGDKPDLLNNLATAYHVQHRDEEAIELIREVHRRWPDYFFGLIAMANLAFEEGNLDRAEEILAGLRRRAKFHVTEFSAMCMAWIRLHVERKQFEAAESWLGMWKNVNPDDPQIGRFERLVAFGGVAGRLMKWMGGRGRSNQPRK